MRYPGFATLMCYLSAAIAKHLGVNHILPSCSGLRPCHLLCVPLWIQQAFSSSNIGFGRRWVQAKEWRVNSEMCSTVSGPSAHRARQRDKCSLSCKLDKQMSPGATSRRDHATPSDTRHARPHKHGKHRALHILSLGDA